MVGWWLMNEGGGSSVFDLSRMQNTGSLQADTSWSMGLTGPATEYDGTGDYIDCGTVRTGTTSKLAFSFWGYRTSSANKIVVGWGDTSSARANVNVFTDGKVYVQNENGASSFPNFTFSGIGWNHFFYDYDGSRTDSQRVRCYLNGVKQALTVGGAWPATTYDYTGDFDIGAEQLGSHFTTGKIDDVRVWERSFSASEVKQLYLNSYAPFTSRRLRGAWRSKPIVKEVIRPDGDVSIGGWTDDGGGTTNIYLAIDETTASDSDYIRSATNPSADTCVVSLTNTSTISTYETSGHRVSYRYQKSATSGRTIELRVRLLQGASTEVASWTHTDIDAITQADQALTTAETALISDWDDLRLEFRGQVSGSGAGRRAYVTWAEVEARGQVAAPAGAVAGPLQAIADGQIHAGGGVVDQGLHPIESGITA